MVTHRARVPDGDAYPLHHSSGLKLKELTAQFNISRGTLFEHMKRLGISRQKISLTSVDISEAADLYREGRSLAQVAERFDVDARTIHLALRKIGVEFRGTHGRKRT